MASAPWLTASMPMSAFLAGASSSISAVTAGAAEVKLNGVGMHGVWLGKRWTPPRGRRGGGAAKAAGAGGGPARQGALRRRGASGARNGGLSQLARFVHLASRRADVRRLDCPAVTHPLLARLRDAARQNAVPAAVLQMLTLLLLLGYYRWTPAHDALDRLLRLKLAWGAAYSFVAGALFAGLLPRLVLCMKGAGGRRFALEVAFACAFWGWRSVEVDLFYRLQAHWFGSAADWRAVLAKTAVDQLLYSPFWAVPEIALAFEWKEAGFSWRVRAGAAWIATSSRVAPARRHAGQRDGVAAGGASPSTCCRTRCSCPSPTWSAASGCC